MANRSADRAPEHDFQLREPEDEVVGLVDEHDIGIRNQLFGESRRQLQPAESRAQHHDPHRCRR
jgi:hypothetical protein